jgi:plastocyanin
MRVSRSIVVVVALACLGLGAGCGDDEPTPVAGAGECTTVTVDIGDFVFEPTPVEIGACDSVAWANVHDQAHTATGSGDVEWTTGNLEPGETSEPVRFDEPGEHSYLCALHPFMDGVVAVT